MKHISIIVLLFLSSHYAHSSEGFPKYYIPYSNGVGWIDTINPTSTSNSLQAVKLFVNTVDGYQFDSPVVTFNNTSKNSYTNIPLSEYLDKKYTNALNNIESFNFNQFSICIYNNSVLLTSGPTNYFKQYCGDKYSPSNEAYSPKIVVTPFSLDNQICVFRSRYDPNIGDNFFVTDIVSKKNLISTNYYLEGIPHEVYWLAPKKILTVNETRNVKIYGIQNTVNQDFMQDNFLKENLLYYTPYSNGLLLYFDDGHGNIVCKTGETYCKEHNVLK